ncbi:Replication protein A 70 kDa DNA-binding subunit B [Vitis vinifera]|uniref:Replication protein A 70 kDa DNA-binding subunit B n=1 Tax=Vitis vinifera TaxID=29760 RepID=A0A438IR62_VITVI|nr:Replication protein A 70 kDa DNA-binding subunit B [Vitis vinifera]
MVESGIGLVRMYQDICGYLSSQNFPEVSSKKSHEQQTVAAQDVDRKKTVVVSLWNDHATNVGQELLDNADKFPIVAIKSLKVGDFQVVSLSTLSESIVLEGEENLFQQKLKEAIWVPQLFRISVAQHEYMNEKRQRITSRAVVPVDFAAESRLLLEEISKMKTSQ